MSTHTKWEHEVILLNNDSVESSPKMLKRMGNEGWELCSVVTFAMLGNVNYIFKRKYQDE